MTPLGAWSWRTAAERRPTRPTLKPSVGRAEHRRRKLLSNLGIVDGIIESSTNSLSPFRDEPSEACLGSLARMSKDKTGYDNVTALKPIFDAAHYPAPGLGKILMAMAIKESNGDPNAVENDGGGRGLLQVDITQIPGKNYASDARPMNAAGNIEISLEIPNTRITSPMDSRSTAQAPST